MIFYFCWGWEGGNSFYILLARFNSIESSEVAQKLDRILSKLASVNLYLEVCHFEGL